MFNSEIISSFHAFIAPRPIKQLSRSFNNTKQTFPASVHREKLFQAEHAPEAAYHAVHSGVDRSTMRRVVVLYLIQDALQTKEQIKRRLKTQTPEDAKTASDYALHYNSIMRNYHALQNPGILIKTIDKAASFLPLLI